MNENNKAYCLGMLQQMLKTVVYTASVKDAIPVSVILVAPSGTAKSKLLKSFLGDGLHQTDSFSSQGLFELVAQDPTNKLRWIVTADMNPTLSRRQSTVEATVANLLTLLMDGTCRVDDGRSVKQMKHNPIGLISACTPDIFAKQTKKWFALGLRRRIIPLFYEYSNETIRELLSKVREDKISGADFPTVRFSISHKHNPAMSHNIALQIEALGINMSTNMGLTRATDSEGKVRWFAKQIIPISPVVVLRTIAKANAIKMDRGQVSNEDVEFTARFVDFTNQSKPMVL